MKKNMAKVVQRKISSFEPQKPQRNTPKVKSKVLGREKRTAQLIGMTKGVMIKRAKELGLKNVQFKKIDKNDPSKNVNRSLKDIADLIYFKEIELDL